MSISVSNNLQEALKFIVRCTCGDFKIKLDEDTQDWLFTDADEFQSLDGWNWSNPQGDGYSNSGD